MAEPDPKFKTDSAGQQRVGSPMNPTGDHSKQDNRSNVEQQGQTQPAVGLKLDQVTIKTPQKCLLDCVSETISAGKITLIVGPSGAGKSVLLRTLAGLLPKSGEMLTWNGNIHLHRANENPTSESRKQNQLGQVGVVFQQFALFDEWSSRSNIQFALDHPPKMQTGIKQSLADASVAKTATDWLDELGVPSNVAVGNLSGGQKQRLAIARTLASSPSVILYDEPTSGLDSASGTKVAELIRSTHRRHGRTSVIVTHDYPTLIPIADEILLFNADTKKLERISRESWSEIPNQLSRLLPPKQPNETKTTKQRFKMLQEVLDTTGGVVSAAATLPLHLVPWFPKLKWGFQFVLHYLKLISGPSAWVYLAIAGMIVGFTSTFFTFRFLPFRLYTQPLLIDELLASVGFALYRILVPILATILIAARCGAAVTADVGVKRYGGQTDALQTMGIRSTAYLLTPILFAFMIATPFLEWLSFEAAKLTSLLTFLHSYPEIGAHFWDQYFLLRIDNKNPAGVFSVLGLHEGWNWVLGKNLLCGIGTAAIAYYRGMQRKLAASDVSSSVTSTVLWATLYVLAVHFTVALFEF